MADNILTNGTTPGQNSSSTGPQPFLDQQQAILDAEQARSIAERRAAEAAFARAKNRPAGNGMQNPGIGGMATYDAMGQPALPNPRKGKKG